ncbi:hypothetical protein COU91_02455 [Candidatus Saccharibacteria bacterium CG10_big_fil_rev_8_21_14_0_10_47_8]|nr:MAG: hypothetical protein COU91_02455 [Candidatus Saccharibacteria bacterium CG10_big_fil_rev_8_21_14_0_10_47_8]
MPTIEDETTPANDQPVSKEPVDTETSAEVETKDFEGPAELPENEPEEVVESKLSQTQNPQSHWQRFHHWYGNHKKLSIPLTVLSTLLVLTALPWTRYSLAGQLISHDVKVRVTDSKTGAPVSEAEVQASSGSTETTSGTGQVSLHKVRAGKTTIKVTKKYYKDGQLKTTVPVFKSSKALNVQMQATGRQVKINVANIITKKGLASVGIKISDVDVKTDASGNATAVLPAGIASQKATLKLSGYNNSNVTIKVSDTEIKENKFNLTPTGRVYFLSNRSGKVDVMKSNLDGSDPVIVLAGTGSEDVSNTVLVASPDWKYLALLAKRDSSASKVYIITTSNDQLTTADEGSANFILSGWLGDKLIYTVSRTDLSPWNNGSGKLKSYDANTGKLILLDQTSGTGDASSNNYEYYGLVFLSGDSVIYGKGWTSQYPSSADYSGKQETLSVISANGQNHKVVSQYAADTKTVYYTPHGPNSVYVVTNTQSQTDYTYYDYVVDSAPKQISLTNDQLYKNYPTYYLSPDGKQTLWTEIRDGNAILVGDTTGSGGKVIATIAGSSPVGWFTGQYVLVSKNINELYIMGVAGGAPLKISSYLNTSYYGLVTPRGNL